MDEGACLGGYSAQADGARAWGTGGEPVCGSGTLKRLQGAALGSRGAVRGQASQEAASAQLLSSRPGSLPAAGSADPLGLVLGQSVSLRGWLQAWVRLLPVADVREGKD